ncbi:MAG: DUF6705 family protein [Leeuwenhoekiella sp.]
MRTLYIILIISLLSLYCKAQNPILSLEDNSAWGAKANTYFKDINNAIDPFVGVWVYEDGAISLRLELKKVTQFYNGVFYEDLIVGEYQYDKNGQTVISTLENLNNSTIKSNEHMVHGHSILKDCDLWPASDCTNGEKRLLVNLKDVLKETIYYQLLLHKRTINGGAALKVVFNPHTSVVSIKEGETVEEPTIPLWGEYVFYKQ